MGKGKGKTPKGKTAKTKTTNGKMKKQMNIDTVGQSIKGEGRVSASMSQARQVDSRLKD